MDCRKETKKISVVRTVEDDKKIQKDRQHEVMSKQIKRK